MRLQVSLFIIPNAFPWVFKTPNFSSSAIFLMNFVEGTSVFNDLVV